MTPRKRCTGHWRAAGGGLEPTSETLEAGQFPLENPGRTSTENGAAEMNREGGRGTLEEKDSPRPRGALDSGHTACKWNACTHSLQTSWRAQCGSPNTSSRAGLHLGKPLAWLVKRLLTQCPCPHRMLARGRPPAS